MSDVDLVVEMEQLRESLDKLTATVRLLIEQLQPGRAEEDAAAAGFERYRKRLRDGEARA